MAKFRIALGGEIDAVTGDEFSSGLDALRRELAPSPKAKPIFRPLSNAFTVPVMADGDQFAVNLGTPASGRVWKITRLTVIGNDDHSTVANLSASLYIGQGGGPVIGDEVMQGQCVLHGQAIPFTSTQNEHAWIAHDRDQVTVLLRAFGAVTSTNIFMSGQAWEYRDRDTEQQAI